MKAFIVTDLGYGDSGKGVTVDYLASREASMRRDSIVIRHSGGPQAGHTVYLEGKKHVFSNYGSGSLRGLPTYFSKHTCFNPYTIQKESSVLEKEFGISPTLYIDPESVLVTCYDIIMNRSDEVIMGHGTVGSGIYYSLFREQKTGFSIKAQDFENIPHLMLKIENYKNYLLDNKLLDSEVLKKYTEFEKQYLAEVSDVPLFKVRSFFSLYDKFDSAIFEGSQGIQLDKSLGIFPNVTPSYTSSRNAFEIISLIPSFDTIEMYYVTRCYFTRHGNGYIPEHLNEITLVNAENETNVDNTYQGEFKVREFDKETILSGYRMDRHMRSHLSPHNWYDINENIVFTCMDQVPGFIIPQEFYNLGADIYANVSPYSSTIMKIPVEIPEQKGESSC